MHCFRTKFGGVAFQLVIVCRASHNVAAVDRAGIDQAFGDRLCHIAVSDESDGWIGHIFFPLLSMLVVAERSSEQLRQISAVQCFIEQVLEHC